MRKPSEIKECLVCAKQIKAWGSCSRRSKRLFCSRSCRGAYQSLNGIEISRCLVCDKEVRITGSRKKKFTNRFCSFYCYGINKRTPNYNPSESVKIRKSWDYAKWRQEVYKRDNFTCQICKARGVKLNADHIKPFSLYPELRLELSNGRTLCVECHLKTPTYGGRSKF